jgi:cell division protein FtsB
MSLDQAFWLFFMLPLVAAIIGLVLWEAFKDIANENSINKQRVRELHQQNHDLRDEIARLQQQR